MSEIIEIIDERDTPKKKAKTKTKQRQKRNKWGGGGVRAETIVKG